MATIAVRRRDAAVASPASPTRIVSSVVTLLLSLLVVGALVAGATRSARLEVELATRLASSGGRAEPPPTYAGTIVRRGAPLWRRIIDLVLLVVIWLFIGLAMTAVLGGALAGLALVLQELLA